VSYLSDPEGHDLQRMIEAARLSRDIFSQPAFTPFRGAPVFPERALSSDAEYTDFIRRKAETIYHPVGTCRMGSDSGAPLDSELRVRGVQGLRVVDASVMPSLPSGNTNAPVVMIAERASTLILNDN
jgi:choline dehydrogenase